MEIEVNFMKWALLAIWIKFQNLYLFAMHEVGHFGGSGVDYSNHFLLCFGLGYLSDYYFSIVDDSSLNFTPFNSNF